MSRASEKKLRRMEIEKEELLKSAFYKLETSPDLRYFVRWLLENCGYGLAPASPDPLTMARQCGMLSIAVIVADKANEITPSLLTSIIQDQNHDRTIIHSIEQSSGEPSSSGGYDFDAE